MQRLEQRAYTPGNNNQGSCCYMLSDADVDTSCVDQECVQAFLTKGHNLWDRDRPAARVAFCQGDAVQAVPEAQCLQPMMPCTSSSRASSWDNRVNISRRSRGSQALRCRLEWALHISIANGHRHKLQGYTHPEGTMLPHADPWVQLRCLLVHEDAWRVVHVGLQ